MSATAGPAYWCHQCNRQTRPIAGGDEILCGYCNGGFVEEMENNETEPSRTFSELPSNIASIFRLPLSSSAREESAGGTGGRDRREPEGQGQRARLISGHRSDLSQLLGVMADVMHQFRDGSANVERQIRPGLSESNTRSIAMPANQMLILRGDMPNFFGGLGNVDVFVDSGLGAGPQLLPGHFGDYFLGPELDRLIQILAENDPNRYGTPPASKAAVEAMPTIKITEDHVGTEAMQCAVCKDDFEIGGDVTQMPCKHMYHADCILPWLAQHNTCPVCRYELPTDDPEYSVRRSQISTDASSGRNVEDENNTAWRENGVDGTARAPDLNGRPRIGRQFTLWGIPGNGLDLSSIFGETRIIDSASPDSRPTSGVGMQVMSGRGSAGTGGGSIGTGDGSRRLPISSPWLFRLISPSGQVDFESEGDRTNTSSRNNAQTSEGDSGLPDIKQEELD
eukprot:c25135_g1_i1 orf=257-1612(+)